MTAILALAFLNHRAPKFEEKASTKKQQKKTKENSIVVSQVKNMEYAVAQVLSTGAKEK